MTSPSLGFARHLFSRLRSMFGGGLMFDGRRDTYATFGYTRAPQFEDFAAKYFRQDIASRIIDEPVDATWSDPPILTADDAFQAAWSDLKAQIPIFHFFQRLDTLAGIGSFAVMVIGFDDARSLERPTSATTNGNGNGGARRVTYLQPYAEPSIEIVEWDEDQASPRFAMPVMYEIAPGSFDAGKVTSAGSGGIFSSSRFRVHHSRVLHVAQNALETTVFGHSQLESVYNLLDDLLKVAGGSAETYWLTANRGLHVNVDKEMDLNDEDQENLTAEVEEYENQIRRIIRTRGVEINSLGSDVADPRGIFDVLLSLIASAKGIPKRILSGSEAGQLASQQDRANWAIKIAQRITKLAEPIMFMPFIRLLINAGALPQPSMLTVEWPDPFKLSPLEKAQTSAQMARSVANVSKTYTTVKELNLKITQAKQNALHPPQPFGGPGGGSEGDSASPPNLNPSSIHASARSTPLLPTTGFGPRLGAAGGMGDIEDMVDNPITKVEELPELFTPEELRKIVGFGKHVPVFDEPSDTATKKTPAEPTSPNTPKA